MRAGSIVGVQLLLAWLGFVGVTGFSIGLFAHIVQDLLEVEPADIHVHFEYNAEEMSGGGK